MQGWLALVARTAVHSAVASIAVEMLLAGFRTDDPRFRQRMRAVSIVLPVATTLAAPAAVRLGWPALLRVEPWITLGVGPVKVGWIFAAFCLLVAGITFAQEIMPWWLHQRVREPLRPTNDPRLLAACRGAFGEELRCFETIPSHSISVRVVGGVPALVVGEGFVSHLDDEELRAVLAHERAHVDRHDLLRRRIVYLLRLFQIASPFSLVQYRLWLNDAEEVADMLAARSTGTPLALAASLLKAHGGPGEGADGEGVLGRAARRIEWHARSIRVKARVRRLLDHERLGPDEGVLSVLVTAIALAAILTGVV